MFDGRAGVIGIHKSSVFMGIVCLAGGTYAITQAGLLVYFGDGGVMEKWVELKVLSILH